MKKTSRIHHIKPIIPEKKLTKLAFLFYTSGMTKETNTLLSDSIKRLKKDYHGSASFFFVEDHPLEDFQDGDTLQPNTGWKILPRGEALLPVPGNDFDYLVILAADGLSREINFNEFFHENTAFPDAGSWSELFFRNQLPQVPGGIILGKDLAEYFLTLPATPAVSLREDLLWYIRNLQQAGSRMLLPIDNPYTAQTGVMIRLPACLSFFRRWFSWNFTTAFREYRSGKKYNGVKESPLLRPLFIMATLLTIVILPVISYHAGISGDEEKHWLQAGKVYDYFASGGEDTLALNDPKYKLNYYGQSFDLFTYAFIKTFHIKKIYETRHVLNGLTGALAIVTTALLVRLLLGNAAGLLCLFLLFFSPRFLGHAMNNPLDIPFALGYIFTLLQTIRFLKRLPEFSVRIALLIVLGIAFTISIRIGGLILIPYLFLFSGLYMIFNRWPWPFMSGSYLKFARQGLVYLLAISLAAYFLSLLPWPYALNAPFKNPFTSLKMMSNITVALRVMFEGKIIWSDNLPWYYIPKDILITVPVIILIFYVVPLFTLKYFKRKGQGFLIFLLYFASLFPVAYIIYKGSNVYGGWRHVMFIYPPLVALSVAGIIRIKDLFRGRIFRTGFILLVLIAMAGPVIHIFRNFPLQYIYYNRLVGGVDKAYKKYETDYYLVSLKPGTEWIKEHVLPLRKKKTSIISNAPTATIDYYFRNYSDTVTLPYTRYYDRGVYNWDYAVFFMNYIDPYQIRKGIWPPKNTVYEVKVDDVPVCAVVKRENRDDFYGIQKLNAGIKSKNIKLMMEGLNMLEQAIKYDPHNEVAYLTLAHGYIIIGSFEKARQKLHQLLSFYPEYDKALNLVAFSYLSEGNNTKNSVLLDRAITILNQVININYKNSQAYYYLGLAYEMKGDDEEALKQFNTSLNLNPRYKDAYYSIASIFDKQGETAKAADFRKYADSL